MPDSTETVGGLYISYILGLPQHHFLSPKVLNSPPPQHTYAESLGNVHGPSKASATYHMSRNDFLTDARSLCNHG